MKLFGAYSLVASLFLFPIQPTAPDGLTPIEPELAKAFGKILAGEADKLEKLQIKILADSEKASGVHDPHKAGVLIVPQKDLMFNEELAEKFKLEKGAPLAYLFLYHLTPIVNGKPADSTRLRSVKLPDENGQQVTVHVLLLSARQLSEDDYRLYAFGHEEKPLVDARFAEGTGPGPEPTAVEVKEVDEQAKTGKLVVTVFGKYQASFQVGHLAD